MVTQVLAPDEKAVLFFKALRHSKGVWAGQPFELLPWQEKIIRDLFGTLRPDGRRQYRTAYIEVPRKAGKALALDTPIPTPKGWATIGELQPGDQVFDEHGMQCNVVATTEVMRDRPCYRVVFSDGEQIIADAEHEWWTKARRLGNGTRGIKRKFSDDIRTTKIIANTLSVGEDRGRVEWNHAIPVTEPLQCEPADLLVEPYVLGAWLGDGHSAAALITTIDAEILAAIERVGVPIHSYSGRISYRLGDGNRSQSARDVSVQARLRVLGLLNNKHIPRQYQRASIPQRMALLRGLMDTDGHVTPRGECEFVTTNERLATDVRELIIGLGFKPALKQDRARIEGRDCGPRYRVRFYSYDNRPVFELARKRVRLKATPQRPTRASRRQIVACEPVESVPVRCIQVDSPSRLYLAGRSMIPTHNSTLAAAIGLYLLFEGEPGAEVYSAAADREQASIVFEQAKAMVEGSPELAGVTQTFRRSITLPRWNASYKVLSADAPTKHGLNAHGIVFDELHAQPNRDLWDVLTTSTGARSEPLVVAITTAGYDRESICYELHEYALKVRDGVIEDDSFYPVIFAAEEADEWDSQETWHKANPSLGITVQPEFYQSEARRAHEMPAYQNTFRRLYLNQWTQQHTRWIDLHLWDDNEGEIDESALISRDGYGGLDLASVSDMTAWSMVFPRPDDPEFIDVISRFWVPEARLNDSSNRYRDQYRTWAQQGWLNVTPGDATDYSFVRDQILRDVERFRIVDVNVDRLFQAHQLAAELESEGLTIFGMGQGFMSMATPVSEFHRRLLNRKINHGGNPVLRWMADGVVVRQDPAGNLKLDKAQSQTKIDGIVALVMALDRQMRHMTEPRGSVYETRGLASI